MKRRSFMAQGCVRAGLVWLACAVAVASPMSHAQAVSTQPPPALPAWLVEAASRLDQSEVVRGEFEQTKVIKGFKKPLVSRGEFVIARGRGIQWVTLTPFPSTLVVTRDRLTTVTPGGTQQIDVRQEPGLRAVNDLLMAVLGGDMKALNTRFQLDGGLQGTQGWRMTLVPRDAALSRFIARIEMEGDRHVQFVRMSEASGDENRIRFTRHGHAGLSPIESERLR